jgi:dienelactone hydrolase
MEGLGGLKDSRERAYGKWLAQHGYVALVVNSFGTRRAAFLPHGLRALAVTESMMCADAYAGLRFLCRHPAIDPERVFVIGFSYGGMISVLTAYDQIRTVFAAGDERFAGHVSYYGCSIPRLDRPKTTGRPVLVMLGELDANVSIGRTESIVGDLRAGGSPVQLEVFEGAYHQWDSDDEEKRFVRFNLNRCAMRVDPDNEIRDETSSSVVRGPISRTLTIVSRASASGYYILRDERIMQRSDQLLLSLLERESTRDVSAMSLPSVRGRRDEGTVSSTTPSEPAQRRLP